MNPKISNQPPEGHFDFIAISCGVHHGQTFACDEEAVEGRSYLRADYSISCDSTSHVWYRVHAGIMILVRFLSVSSVRPFASLSPGVFIWVLLWVRDAVEVSTNTPGEPVSHQILRSAGRTLHVHV